MGDDGATGWDRVQVAVALPLSDTWTYAAPACLDLRLGHVVQVPFGPRRVTGYVVGPGDPQVPAKKLKRVRRVLDPVPAFDDAQLDFFRWMARYYLAGLGEVIATALPSSMKARTRRVFVPTDDGVQDLARPSLVEEPQTTVLREVVSRPGLTASGLVRRLHGELDGDAVKRHLDALVRARLVQVEERESRGPQAKVTVVRRTERPVEQPPRGARMRSVLARIEEREGVIDLAELVGLEGGGAREAVKRLERDGLVGLEEREDRRAAQEATLAARAGPPPVLNAEQAAAVEALSQALQAAEAGAFLLHGVTGSGKTEVYLHAAAACLEQGRQVLLLVPEISLTPQLTGRVKARFGDAVAVLHSGLTGAGRLREWRRIRAGEAQVAVGARSALFAPFADLGLLIIDEEHDDSYKQDEGVRYHARDLAVVRAHLAGCPVVLGSATPSAESWQNAREGRYRMLRLPRRATPKPVPQVELVDQRGQAPGSVLSDELIAALERTLAAGGKAIVLYNRRGYAPVVECPGCGSSYSCPSCGVGLVYHRGGRGHPGRLQCHYCGFHQPFRPDCPTCGTDVEVLGHGTARVEEALQEAFPEVTLARMDADTTRSRGAHQEILERFRSGDTRILVGTQMVAKGHDFPDVHLAAVVGVDHLLMLPDFRSAERVHALVTQLAGRAGRGDTPGRVLVQTRQPEHFVFRFLAERDPRLPDDVEPGAFPLVPALDAFLVAEVHQRQLMGTPPHSSLVLIRIEGTDRDGTRRAAAELVRRLVGGGPEDPVVRVRGPISAPLGRLVGRWRYQVVIRSRDRARLRGWLQRRRPILTSLPSGLRLSVDVDPRSLL